MTLMGVIQARGLVTVVEGGKEPCPLCMKQHGSLEETPATKADASELASKVDAMVKSKKGRHLSTMLGVVQCKCGQKYADQSSVTFVEFCDVVQELGGHAPAGSLSIDVRDEDDKFYNATIEQTRSRLLARFGEENVMKIWAKAKARADKSSLNRTGPAAYPPGACAAPKTIALALDGGAYPDGLTEQYFHAKGKPTGAPIKYLDKTKGEPGGVVVRKFEHGTTVPPCRTCELIIPLMLCPGDKEEMCQHKD